MFGTHIALGLGMSSATTNRGVQTMRYRKIRFYSKQHGETAGLVIQHDGKTFHSIEELSRLFPMHEALKMQKFQSSPVFDTWNEAFAFEFPSPVNR